MKRIIPPDDLSLGGHGPSQKVVSHDTHMRDDDSGLR